MREEVESDAQGWGEAELEAMHLQSCLAGIA
jgi:hypothetical protein